MNAKDRVCPTCPLPWEWPFFLRERGGVRILWPKELTQDGRACICAPIYRWLGAIMILRARRRAAAELPAGKQ